MKPASFGTLAACLAQDIPPGNFAEAVGICRGLKKSGASSEAFAKQLAGFANDVYVQAGLESSLERHLFQELTKVAHWELEHFDFVEPVLLALSTVKSATTASGITGIAMELPKYLWGGAALTGGALGTLGWALNRDAATDDAKSKSLAARTQYYKNLAGEISRELHTSPQPGVRRALKATMFNAEDRIPEPTPS
jgi:hypothetical protein